LGVDISEGMIKKFDELIEDEGLKNTRTVVTELKGADGELNNARFDVIIVSYYHEL
jgi:predicted methyltransferase